MSARAERLVDLLPGAEVDVMLVTELINVRYLTGYTGTNGLALVGPQQRVFITDFRYTEQAAEEVDHSFDRHTAALDLLEAIGESLGEGEVRLGFEAAHVSVRQHDRLRELLPARVELVGAEGLVEGLRAVKEPEELARVKAAAELADGAFAKVVRGGLIGRTERELALALEVEMREHGARRSSFETIVASGPQGSLPHAQPRDEPVRRGQLVVMDWGALLEGYCSDCTRTLAAGEPDEQAREVYQLVLDAQLAGLGAVRVGAGGREVDSVPRALIDAAGQGEHFGHGLGHGVGLDIHERPRLSQRSSDQLAAGNVVTVEPGVYVPGRFGVRIEDLVVVGEGQPQILTSIAKELTVVD